MRIREFSYFTKLLHSENSPTQNFNFPLTLLRFKATDQVRKILLGNINPSIKINFQKNTDILYSQITMK